MSAAVPQSVERCDECGRNPRTINSDMSECSVIECPHRRRQWSDGTGHPAWRPEKTHDPLGPLFDKVED